MSYTDVQPVTEARTSSMEVPWRLYPQHPQHFPKEGPMALVFGGPQTQQGRQNPCDMTRCPSVRDFQEHVGGLVGDLCLGSILLAPSLLVLLEKAWSVSWTVRKSSLPPLTTRQDISTATSTYRGHIRNLEERGGEEAEAARGETDLEWRRAT